MKLFNKTPVQKSGKNTEVLSLQDQMNQLFDSFFTDFSWDSPTKALDKNFYPGLDLKETETEYKVDIELPGMHEEDIDLSVHDNTLFLKGHKRFEEEKKDEKIGYHRIERSYGSFSRTIPFSEEIDEKNITANLKNGILKVRAPKIPKDQAKKIKININNS